jgi:3-deoxy-manno-octulosonate cytidylyltransferase (CMP-KDO synthetase)
MRMIALIPSRYGSSRFPGKPLALIAGKPMIQWVYENVSKVRALDGIYVATDDQRIFDCVEGFGGNALMTSSAHTCGTDRLAECSDILKLEDEDIVLNIQGDEPLIREEMILDLIGTFDDVDVYMGTLRKEIETEEELNNPNVVKVITDLNDNAIYFSRYAIPYERDGMKRPHYKHIGVYGYKVWFLKKYSRLKKTGLELAESLEQLRVIENGYHIRVRETHCQTIGVDTPEQVELVEKEIQKAGL